MNKSIILVDFSKVISPIGISRHLADILSKYLTISKEKIRDMYKKHIGLLVKGQYSILQFIDEISPFLKNGYSKQYLIKCVQTMPPISYDFLAILKNLRKTHQLYLASDIYPELGIVVKKRLSKYFDKFIFSFQEGYKKSESQFWENLDNKFFLQKVSHFIDDKQENLDLAAKYNIKGILYTPDLTSQDLFKQIYIKKKTIILGAGAAAIHYADLSQENDSDYLIIEKNKYPFGLMKSYQLGSSFYDLGGHALHNHNEKVLHFLEKKGVLSDKQTRKAFIDYDNRYIPFPFQLHLWYLDKKEKEICLREFLKTSFFPQNKKVNNLDEYLISTFGSAIYKSFLRPYNYKIWKTDLKLIATNWKKRITYEGFDSVLRGYLEPGEENYGSNSKVNYPQQGGFQSYLIPFFNGVKDKIIYNTCILEVDKKNKLLHTNQGSYLYNTLISTIPLNELLEYCNISIENNIFQYLSLQVIAILAKKQDLKMQRIYNKESKYYHHKLAINTNSSVVMQQLDETLFQFEISSKNGKKKLQMNLECNALKYLLDKKLITSEKDILQIDYQEVKYAYPIQTLDFLKQKTKIIKKLNRLSIFPLGRFGTREYLNYDQVLINVFNLYRELENENFSF